MCIIYNVDCMYLYHNPLISKERSNRGRKNKLTTAEVKTRRRALNNPTSAL